MGLIKKVPPLLKLYIWHSGLLCSERKLETDFSRQPVCPVFKSQSVLFDCLTLEYVTDVCPETSVL
jgi:hypothetical protein